MARFSPGFPWTRFPWKPRFVYNIESGSEQFSHNAAIASPQTKTKKYPRHRTSADKQRHALGDAGATSLPHGAHRRPSTLAPPPLLSHGAHH
jgi:hypothetical protein